MQELYPDAKFGYGPAIEEGFYYDIDFVEPIVEEDLKKIEKKMHELSSKDERIVREVLSKEDQDKIIIGKDLMDLMQIEFVNDNKFFIHNKEFVIKIKD